MRVGVSDPAGPAMMPHASSGWSALAWATMASTMSAGMRNTPLRLSRFREAERHRAWPLPDPERFGPAVLGSIQQCGDQRILHCGEPAVGGVHGGFRALRILRPGREFVVLGDLQPHAQRQPDVVECRDPGAGIVLVEPDLAAAARQRVEQGTAAASFSAIRSG